MKAQQTIKIPLTKAFHRRAYSVRAFRFACTQAYRKTGNDVYICNQWVLPWYLNC
jgi:hypothetical protein